MSGVININFRQIWYIDVKGSGWVSLELSVILSQTVGRSDMRVTPYTSVLTLAKLKYFMFKAKDERTKNYKVALLLITQGDIQRHSSTKVNPDRPIQNFD